MSKRGTILTTLKKQVDSLRFFRHIIDDYTSSALISVEPSFQKNPRYLQNGADYYSAIKPDLRLRAVFMIQPTPNAHHSQHHHQVDKHHQEHQHADHKRIGQHS